MDIKSKTKKIIQTLLRKVFIQCKIYLFKYVINIQNGLIRLLHLQVRMEQPNALLVGHDEKLDEIIHIAAMKLIEPDIFIDTQSYFSLHDFSEEVKDMYVSMKKSYSTNQQDVEEMIADIASNGDIANTRKNYWLVCHYYESDSSIERQESAAYYMDKARSIEPDVIPLTSKSLGVIRKKAKKEAKKVESVISDRGALKISLRLKTLGAIVVLTYPLLLITGYFYNKLLLGSFGINMSNFLSVEDYISSSIEQIEGSAIAAVVTILIMYMGIQSDSRKSKAQIEHERKKRDYFPHLMLAICTGGFIVAYLQNNHLMMVHAATVGLIILIFIASGYIAYTYFERPLPIAFSLVFLLAVSGQMVISLTQRIHDLEYGDIASLKKYEFKFDSTIPHSEKNMVLITSSKEFFIFRDIVSKTSIVVPRKHIILFTALNNQKESSK